MAFWGTEVKPGKPFNHQFDQVRGRLRISQATLGIGSSTKTSLLQCNVGDRSPVLLCALLPDKNECCHLDLEFEEAEEVIFSVIGPRSVHLSGYYVGNSRSFHLNDDTESYGEDIANTESGESVRCSDEDDYEDSFINDSDPEVLPPSPTSSDRVVDEEMFDKKKPKDKKGRRKRLKKKYQVDSDDDNSSQQQNVVNGSRCVPEPESEDEDKFPISSLCSSKKTTKDTISKVEEKADKDLGETVNGKIEEDKREEHETHVTGSERKVDAGVLADEPERGSDLPYNILPPSNDVGNERHSKAKKKRKERSKEEKIGEADQNKHSNVLKEDKAEKVEAEYNTMDRDPHKPPTEKESEFSFNSSLPSAEMGSEDGSKRKKRRKKGPGDEKSFETGIAGHVHVLNEDQTKQDEAEPDNGTEDFSAQNEEESKPNDKKVDIDSNQLASECQSKEKKTKKKKKKSKTSENENVNIGGPLMSKEENGKSSMEIEDKNVDANSFERRTLSSGLIIEEIEKGKPDGTMAVHGKKVKVHYVGMIRDSGKVFDSNTGKAPYRFRLGADDVIEGWNVGLDGMHVGGKRRLTISPSMGYGSQGAGENIPPNSWLVYEVELLGVR